VKCIVFTLLISFIICCKLHCLHLHFYIRFEGSLYRHWSFNFCQTDEMDAKISISHTHTLVLVKLLSDRTSEGPRYKSLFSASFFICSKCYFSRVQRTEVLKREREWYPYVRHAPSDQLSCVLVCVCERESVCVCERTGPYTCFSTPLINNLCFSIMSMCVWEYVWERENVWVCVCLWMDRPLLRHVSLHLVK